MLPAMIRHGNLELRPLTAEITAKMPDLDPVRRDSVAARSEGWVALDGSRHAPQLIRNVTKPGDAIYYWDGPWGTLSGSRGIAVVRPGLSGPVVIATFTTVMS